MITLAGGQDSTTVIHGFTVQHGRCLEEPGAGGIFGDGVSAVIRGNIIRGNLQYQEVQLLAASGISFLGAAAIDSNQVVDNWGLGVFIGAEYSGGLPVRIRRNSFRNNSAGGMRAWGGTLEICDNTFEFNSANSAPAAAFSGDSVLFARNHVADNQAVEGAHYCGSGGVECEGDLGSTIIIADNIFLRNTSPGYAGALVYTGGAYIGGGLLRITGNRFIENQGDFCGAIYAHDQWDDVVEIENNLFHDNTAQRYGAFAIAYINRVSANTFVQNRAMGVIEGHLLDCSGGELVRNTIVGNSTI